MLFFRNYFFLIFVFLLSNGCLFFESSQTPNTGTQTTVPPDAGCEKDTGCDSDGDECKGDNCLLPPDAECKNNVECETNHCTDDICVFLPLGGECNMDRECDSGDCKDGECAFPLGECQDNSGCPNNKCVENRCLLPVSAQCTAQAECETNFCDAGTCAFQPLGGICTMDGECKSEKCVRDKCVLPLGLTCVLDTDCGSGLCSDDKKCALRQSCKDYPSVSKEVRMIFPAENLASGFGVLCDNGWTLLLRAEANSTTWAHDGDGWKKNGAFDVPISFTKVGDFRSKAFFLLPTTEIKICYKNPNRCAVLEHDTNMPLRDFFTAPESTKEIASTQYLMDLGFKKTGVFSSPLKLAINHSVNDSKLGLIGVDLNDNLTTALGIGLDLGGTFPKAGNHRGVEGLTDLPLSSGPIGPWFVLGR